MTGTLMLFTVKKNYQNCIGLRDRWKVHTQNVCVQQRLQIQNIVCVLQTHMYVHVKARLCKQKNRRG